MNMRKTDNELRLEALNYAEKNKIVNSKSIQAFFDGYRTNDNETSFKDMLKYIIDKWNHSKEYIESDYQTYLAYGGYESGESRRNELYNQKQIAMKCKEALNILIEKNC